MAGEDPLDLGPPVGSGSIPHDAVVERAYAFLLTSLGQMFAGVDPVENLALASLACAVDDDEPHAHLCRWIVSLIDRRAEYVPGGPQRPPRFAPGLPMMVLAATLARTPDVPLPDALFGES